VDKERFVQNVKKLCLMKNIKPTNACKESGVGSSFLSDIQRGQTPSVSKVQLLAQYLGVTTSDLLGEAQKSSPPSEEDRLLAGYDALSARNREKLEEYLDLLLSSQDRP
jgi:transcriptional regulator with XRE-family HTH domain